MAKKDRILSAIDPIIYCTQTMDIATKYVAETEFKNKREKKQPIIILNSNLFLSSKIYFCLKKRNQFFLSSLALGI
jgi:hypothetical protein